MRLASEDRRQQLPWVVLGLTVTLTAAIVFALWASSLSNRTAVAVAGRDIAGGSTVEIGDLRAVEVASGQGAGFVPMSDLDSVVGRTVRAAIPEGTILHPELLSTSSPIDQDKAVVGVVLQAGGYPIAQLSPGQSVGVVFTGENLAPSSADRDNRANQADPPSIADSFTQAKVAEVSKVLESGQEALFVSLLASADDAVPISRAAAFNELRLILLPAEPRPASDLLNQESTMTGAPR
ncbi:SAF domain-containing protein [Candidatus Poriferisocius sp.]|uniref:SAF domain-containing protein n=1 Tax=Candidatus Poriferisocius sp. TaxID=3101276 RepID=UPI003B527930